MLTTEERILLRDLLFQELLKLKVIIYYSHNGGYYALSKKSNFINALNNNDNLRYNYWWYIKEFRTEKEALYCLLKQDDFSNHMCPYCNNKLIFYIAKRSHGRYRETCGDKECIRKAHDTEESKQKRENTCKEVYGVDNVANIPGVQERKEQTCTEKYGYVNPFQVPEFQEKARQTNLANLGVEYPTQSKEVREKVKQTVLKRYNVENIGQSILIQTKVKQTKLKRYGDENYNNHEQQEQTCLEKYGYINPFQVPQFKEKAKQTLLNIYNVDNPSKSYIIQSKILQTRIINNTKNNPIRDIDIQNIILDLNILYQRNITISEIYINQSIFLNFISLLSFKKDRLLTLKEVADIFGFTPCTIRNKIKICNLFNYFHIQHSKLEDQFKDFLISHNIQFEQHNRNILDKSNKGGHLELDFYLPDYNIAFEINDINSHNAYEKHYMYHRNKTINCLSKGIELIHIWEWELTDEILWNRLQNWILNLLSNQKIQINESNYTLQVLSIEEQELFLNEYNLKGYIESDLSLGIYYNNKLIHIFSFNELDNDQYELVNNCTKFGYEILNIEELIESIIEVYNMNSLITYYDVSKIIRKNLLSNFKIVKTLSPSLIGLDNDIYCSMYDCGEVISVLFNNKGEDKN